MITMITTIIAESDLLGIPLTNLTPAALLGATVLLLFFGKLVPERSVKKIEEFYQQALARERTTADEVLASLSELTRQNEMTLEILKKLPTEKKQEYTYPPENTMDTFDFIATKRREQE